jgi:hypothetical protein
MFDHYQDKNEELFKSDELVNSIKSDRDELENLCILLKLMVEDKAFPVDEEILEPFYNGVCETIEWIYKTDSKADKNNDIYMNDCKEKLKLINEKCDIINQKMQGINLDDFKSSLTKNDIIITGTSEQTKENTCGTSIADLMKRRQQDILVDKINKYVQKNQGEDINEDIEEIVIYS